jgi:hypothetical protein
MIFIAAVGLVGAATPGRRRRKLFAAVSFPFLAVLGLLVASSAGTVIGPLASVAEPAVNLVLRGPVLGAIAGAMISLLAVLIYRTVVTPVALLALVPALAKTNSAMARFPTGFHEAGIFASPFWTLGCCALAVVIITTVTARWMRRSRLIYLGDVNAGPPASSFGARTKPGRPR